MLPDLGCACAAVRRAARLVTSIYDEELRGHLESSQFSLLTMLEQRPGSTQAVMARAMGFDKTTLSRNLSLMKKKGWVAESIADDQRERGLQLTESGRKLLAEAKPGWNRAQERLRSGMTDEQWEAMWAAFRAVSNAAVREKAQKKGANRLPG